MERINAPSIKSVLLKKGETVATETKVINELGIYGIFVRYSSMDGWTDGRMYRWIEKQDMIIVGRMYCLLTTIMFIYKECKY